MLVWPSSQRTRKRAGCSWSTSSITPLRAAWATRSDSTTIRSPTRAVISCSPPRRNSKPESNFCDHAEGARFEMATEDLTRLLDEAGVPYELLSHARTESAVAEAEALGLAPADVAKTLVVTTPER